MSEGSSGAPDRVSPLLPTVHTSFSLDDDLVDMKGKVVLVTGGNKGIGYATVRHLLRAKASKVYLAARSEERAKEAIAALNEEGLGVAGSGSEVVWVRLDLGDPREARKAAEEFLEREERLDVLVNNAGDMSSTTIGKDGVSDLHIINFISPYVFTRGLLPLLKRTAQAADSDVRIVNVSSKTHELIPLSVQFKTVEDFNVKYTFRPFSNLHRYGNSKLAMILWSRHLQKQLIPSEELPNGITVISLHPGSVDTFSMRAPAPLRGVARAVTSLFAVSADVGSLTSVFAAASKQVKEERERYQADGGVYLVDKPVPGTRQELSAYVKVGSLSEDVVNTVEEFLKTIGV